MARFKITFEDIDTGRMVHTFEVPGDDDDACGNPGLCKSCKHNPSGVFTTCDGCTMGVGSPNNHWEPKLAEQPAPVETGLDADGNPKPWSWWDEPGYVMNKRVVIGYNSNKQSMIMFMPSACVAVLSPEVFGQWKFQGMSDPGCGLDKKPLDGSVWTHPIYVCTDSVLRIVGERIFFHCSKYNKELSDSLGLFMNSHTFLRMSQLDPPKPEPLSKTIAVGDVVSNGGIEGSDLCEGPVVYVPPIGVDSSIVAVDEKYNNGAFWADAKAVDRKWFIVSRATDAPLHERIRLGSILRFPDGQEKPIRSIWFDPGLEVWKVTYDVMVDYARLADCTLVKL